MNLYLTKNNSGNSIAIIQFGIGLLGSAIANRISSNVPFKKVELKKFPFNWSEEDKYAKSIELFFSKYLEDFRKTSKTFVIWSAGRAGFEADSLEAENQLRQFKAVNTILSNNLVKIHMSTHYILLSSAGGLFEGQVAVNNNSKPLPLRPYGQLKLNEEQFIKENNLFDEFQILRISSVYSIDVLRKRKGLIQVLMENGLRHKVTNIFGNESTLRDYVLDQDIAKFISNSIITDEYNEMNFLVSGKPSSIYEIRKSIEKVLGKCSYAVFSAVRTNSLDISFSSAVVAGRFVPSEYITNLRLHYQKLNS